MFAVSGSRTQAGIDRRQREARAAAMAQTTIDAAKEAAKPPVERRDNVIWLIPMQVDMPDEPVEPAKPYAITFAEIERRALKVFDIARSELRSPRNHADIAFARHFVMYWAARLTSLSMPQIGRLMGGKDHTTVLHGRNVYPAKRAKMGRYLRAAR